MVFGTREPVTSYNDELCHNRAQMIQFCAETTKRGVYYHDYGGGPCHHGFSSAHTEADIDQILQATADSFAVM